MSTGTSLFSSSGGSIFGAASGGSLFGNASSGSIFGNASSGSIFCAPTSGSIFGASSSGSLFGNASGGSIFGAPAGGSIFGSPAAATGAGAGEGADEGDDEPAEEEDPGSPHSQAPALGEEDEEVMFRAECKLSKLVPVERDPEQPKENGENEEKENKFRWVERGTGVVRLLKHPDTNVFRLVVRQKAVHNVLLNTPLVGTVLKEGQKTVRITEAAQAGESKLCRLKLASEQDRNDLANALAEATSA